MLRLLQGDVGSGKTVVALLAMASVVEAGQAGGHHGADRDPGAPASGDASRPLAEAAGLRVALLTGRDKGRERDASSRPSQPARSISWSAPMPCFRTTSPSRDLALAVVDEQHRFGVHQRLALAGKGAAVDVLVMTATPIPRTLVLTYFGDMDVSALTEKPAGRKPVDTRLVALERLDEVVAAVGTDDRGRRAEPTGSARSSPNPKSSTSPPREDRYRDLAGRYRRRASACFTAR